MCRTYLATLAVAACWACSSWADNAGVDVGVLTCTLSDPSEAPATDAPSQERSRETLCTFQAKTGPQDTYVGLINGVSLSGDHAHVLIWVVRSVSGAVQQGALQQVFATESKNSAEQKPPLIGERNSDIALHSMADKTEGSASAAEKPMPTGFVVLSVEFKLMSASG